MDSTNRNRVWSKEHDSSEDLIEVSTCDGMIMSTGEGGGGVE